MKLLTRSRSTARAATATAAALIVLAIAGATTGTATAATPSAGTGAGPCNYSSARPALQQGDTGPAVKQAQCYLLHTLIIDDIIEVDGDFDAETALRVRQFQSCAGLPVNGAVASETWSVFEQYISSGRVC
jgi:peptidoglycan hydrolase-like protein with peptidoglycan-binding domain